MKIISLKFLVIFQILLCYLTTQIQIQSQSQILRKLHGINKKLKKNINFQFKSGQEDDASVEENESEKEISDLEKVLPGLQEFIIKKLGAQNKNVLQGQSLDISSLIHSYQMYIEQKSLKQLVGKVDLSKLNLKSFDLNFNNERVLMPYDQRYKIGDGFNVELGQPRSSPFYLPAILQSPPKSIEGQDGQVSYMLAISQEDMAQKLAVQASLWGSGWGASAKASFSYSKDFKMSTNEVVLISSHKINMGKAFIDPSNFILTQDAQKLLATNYEEFIKSYGTHFLAGIQSECEMNAIFRQKTTSEQSKSDIAASLEASYKSIGFEAGGTASASYSSEKSQFHKNTEISVSYAGANDDAFLTGLEIQDLQSAILQFPQHCTGNVAKYILWPYESAQSFIDVKTKVDLLIIEEKKQTKLNSLKNEQVANAKEQISQLNEEKQADYTKYLEELEEEQNQKKAEIQKKVDQSQEYLETVTLLDEVFTAAILKNRIIRVGLEEEKIFILKTNEIVINNNYKVYKSKLQELVSSHESITVQLDLIKEARAYLQNEIAAISTPVPSVPSTPSTTSAPSTSVEVVASTSVEVVGSIQKISSYQCEDENCADCNHYALSECKVCANGFALTDSKKCTEDCNSGYYKGQVGGIAMCIQCNPICRQCSTAATYCTSCEVGSFLQESNCVKTCQNGYYINNKQCLRCTSENNCETQNKCECLSCPKSFGLKNGKCLSSCGNSYYMDKNTQKCEQCHQFCQSCFGSLVRECTQCTSNYNLQETTCQIDCKNGYYKKENTCLQCKQISFCENCKNNFNKLNFCEDNSECICSRCTLGYFQFGQRCVDTCQWTYFNEKSKRICEKCNTNCGYCTDKDNCTKCENGYVLFEKKCHEPEKECKEGYYLQGGLCQKCNYGWKRCDGCIVVYDRTNFYKNNRYGLFCTDDYKQSQEWSNLRTLQWGDRIESIQIGSGTKLELFTQQSFGGKAQAFTSEISDLSQTSIGKNEVVSFKISVVEPQTRKTCPSGQYRKGSQCLSCNHGWARCAGCIKVYSYRDYGRNQELICAKSGKNYYAYDLGSDKLWYQDDIDSIEVGYGTKVILYRDPGFTGRSLTLTEDAPDLDKTTVGRNAVSSLEIFVID